MATSSAPAGSRRSAAMKDLVTRNAHSQTFFPVAVEEAETPSLAFNAAGERVGRMGAGEALDELVLTQSNESAGPGREEGRVERTNGTRAAVRRWASAQSHGGSCRCKGAL